LSLSLCVGIEGTYISLSIKKSDEAKEFASFSGRLADYKVASLYVDNLLELNLAILTLYYDVRELASRPIKRS